MPICVLCIANIGINPKTWVYIGCTFSYFGLLFQLSVSTTRKRHTCGNMLNYSKIRVFEF